jgi:hypothetical protein
MTFNAFIDAAQRRAQIYDQPNGEEEDEEDEAEPIAPPFSIQRILDEKGEDYIRQAIRLDWDEFQALFQIIEGSIRQKGRGRRRSMEGIDRFFILMVFLTSGCTLTQMGSGLGVSRALITRVVHQTLDDVQAPLEQFFPATQADIQCEATFDNHPDAFGIVDASPIFIQRPTKHQDEYYSGKFKRHCVKVQACITPDGQCVHLSKVYRGRTHDKAMFDHSGLAEFLLFHPPGSDAPRHQIIIGDLGYLGINRTCPGALLPHKKPAHGRLTPEQKHENQILSRDRILIENFFGRWKMLFGVCHEVYRGDLKLLSKVVRVTIAITNWYLRLHPLRQGDAERIDESDGAGPARELDSSSSSSDTSD